MQVVGHEVLRKASPVVKKVPAKVQKKDVFVVGIGSEAIIDGHVQAA